MSNEVATTVSRKVVSWLVDRLLKLLFNYVEPGILSMYIENDWDIVDAIEMALNEDDGFIRSASPNGYGEYAIHMRRALLWVIDAVLGIVETVIRKYGEGSLDKYLTVDYVMNYLRNNYPALAGEIEQHGDMGLKWLDRQLRQLKLFFLGKAVWDSVNKRTIYLD